MYNLCVYEWASGGESSLDAVLKGTPDGLDLIEGNDLIREVCVCVCACVCSTLGVLLCDCVRVRGGG